MSTGLSLFLFYLLLPLAVILTAAYGRPLLALPARLSPRLTPEAAYQRSLLTLILATFVALMVVVAFVARLGPFGG